MFYFIHLEAQDNLRPIFKELKFAGTLRQMYGKKGNSITFKKFKSFIHSAHSYSVIDDEDNVVGIIGLNNIEEQAARFHFISMPKTSCRDSLFIGHHAINHFLEKSYKVITCIIPTDNAVAIKFAKKIGFKFYNEPMKDYYDYSDGLFGFITQTK